MAATNGLFLGIRDDHSAPRQLGRRGAVFLAVLLAHIGLIFLLILSRQITQPKKQGSLSVFSLSASPSATPIAMPLPIVAAEAEPVSTNPAEAFAEQEQAVEGDPDGEVCSPLQIVSAELANDPLVPLAISRVARTDRSISEAIVMWNTSWSVAAAPQDAPLGEVRERVIAILASLPPDCLSAPVTGPRLIAIPQNGYTTFLAFGSGEWSWQQLVDTRDPELLQNEEWTWEQLIKGDLPLVL